MKKILLFILLCLNLSLFSQDYSQGIISYKNEIKDPDIELPDTEMFRELLEAFEVAKGLDFELKFKNGKAKFYTKKFYVDEYLEDHHVINPYYNNYYYNLNSDSLLIVNTKTGKKKMEKLPLNEWLITDETKMIKGYKCIKATKTRYSEFNGKKLTFYNEAWFTPSIPLPYGPLNSMGLPGLVLVRIHNNAKIYVDKITFKQIDDID